ncbi:MAG: hypothetical protein HY978_03780 [Candidatus Liptonbacteria bacterium]|nr:hypothetical protein [Candidatus Liptonbacteria bacterium]
MMDLFYRLAITAHAAGTQISANVPAIGGASATTTDPLVTTMSYFKFVLGLVGFLALIMIVIGAVMYTLSSGSSSKQSEAKDYVKSAFFGMLLLAGAVFIYQVIGLNTVCDSAGKNCSVQFAFPSDMKDNPLKIVGPATNLCVSDSEAGGGTGTGTGTAVGGACVGGVSTVDGSPCN